MLALEKLIIETAGAIGIIDSQTVQTLWSGYGEIKRYHLSGGKYSNVIVKHIQLPDKSRHPKGWNTDLSHQRKLTSYQVEKQWYAHFAKLTNAHCKVPQCYHAVEMKSELLLILEDLDAIGYSERLTPNSVKIEDVKNVLTWLAHFHAKFMEVAPNGLWPIGTYWHLDTRPDELELMQNRSLKDAAKAIDECLNSAKHQTLVHGDAKLANFCFGKLGKVSAVDFQYVGKGCGMKDVAYFISSCCDEEACEKYEVELLNHYFNQLEIALDNHSDYQSIKEEWSVLYRYAWADFYRFLDGWNPEHWKMHRYSERLSKQVIAELRTG